MPDLIHSFSHRDIGFLRSVAELWGVSCEGRDARTYARNLIPLLTDETLFQDLTAGLTTKDLEALADLKTHAGQMPWSMFTRKYGELRSMGSARRDREKPFLFPTSTVERLYYRALMDREFLQTDAGAMDMAYIPHEFLPLLDPLLGKPAAAPPARLVPLPNAQVVRVRQSSGQLLDDTCTLLAALRMEQPGLLPRKAGEPEAHWAILTDILRGLNFFLPRSSLPSETAKTFLGKPRGEGLAWLASNWAVSKKINELRLAPSLRCEGAWQNLPLPPRRLLLEVLDHLAGNTWYSFTSLVALFQQSHFYFLRESGDFNTWIISSREPGDPLLTGDVNWSAVEGEWLRFLISGPLFWFGLVDLGKTPTDELTFRKSAWFSQLLAGEVPAGLLATENPVTVTTSGDLEMTSQTSLMARYQLSRFAEWVEVGPQRYRYRLTPASLSKAAEQGLTPQHLLKALRKYSRASVPPYLSKAIERWEKDGRQAWMERLTVLRLASPEQLQELRTSPAGKYLGESLGTTSVILRPVDVEKVRAALTRMGYFADIEEQPE